MRAPIIRSPHLPLLAFAVASLLLPAPASATARSCGDDAIANTASVLCAPPSGPCSATAVTLSANIEVTSSDNCYFDLGGRTLMLKSRQPMVLGSGSRYLARPGGLVQTIHPPGQDPIIGTGVIFDPPRTDTVVANGVYERCPAP